MGESKRREGSAQYVFKVEFRIDPTMSDVTVTPSQFTTTLYRDADQPGQEGWLFFRDNLWHGELADQKYFRELTEEALDVTVTSVSFSELQTNKEYLEQLRSEIGINLEEFNADNTDEVLSKYLGSSIRVTSDSD